MKELIDKSAVVAEIKRRIILLENNSDGIISMLASGIFVNEYKDLLSFLDTLEVKEVDFPCDENRDKELALSLQIQAYLNTASDELYGKGKPLYSKSHLEGIHECMKMWAKLHDYYFKKNTCENKEVDFERELSKYVTKGIHRFFPNVDDDYCKMESFIWQDYVIETAKHFFELGLKTQKEK